MTAQDLPRGRAIGALLALAAGSFGIGTTEFVIMGLLPEVAEALLPAQYAASPESTIAQAGLLISVYALGVVVGAPTIAATVAKYPRRTVMIALAAALTVTNALTVIAPTFELVLVSRFLAGLPHGAYFGIAALVAADLLGPARRAQAISFVLTGLSVANVVGVPLGTFLGQAVGWRAAFAVVALVFVVATVAIVAFVPARPGTPGRTLRAELQVFRIRQIWFTLGIGAIGFGGFFAVYSFVSPMVTQVAGAPEWAVPVILVLMGVGMTVGNLVGGALADRDLHRTLVGAFIGMAVSVAIVGVVAQWVIPLAVAVFLLGATVQMVGPSIQARLMDVAGENQSIAAALNHSSLNIGNSLGAWLGGVVIALGLGYTAPAWVGVALALVGITLLVVSLRLDRRDAAARTAEGFSSTADRPARADTEPVRVV